MAIPSVVGDNTAKGEKIAGPGATTVTFGGKPPALVNSDKTDHGEIITGPGAPKVTIEGKVLAVVDDKTTVSVIKRNRPREYWGPGPITGPGAAKITVGT